MIYFTKKYILSLIREGNIEGIITIAQERESEIEFLTLMNENKRTLDLVHSALSFFRKQYDLEAVGIRLNKDNKYPYFGTQGFPEEFVQNENNLCAQAEIGNFICDSTNSAIKEYVCGKVICGRFNPSGLFLAGRRSYWTNSTAEPLVEKTFSENQEYVCTRCNCRGYESLALIALRADEEILGFLQLNDTRKRQFTPEKLIFMERLAGYLASSLLKARVEEFLLEAYETHLVQSETLEIQSNELKTAYKELKRSEEKYRNIVETANEGIVVIDAGHSIAYINEKMAEMLGYCRDEVIGKSVRDFTDEEGKAAFEMIMKKRRQGNTESHEFRFITKAGFPLWTQVNSKPLFNMNGEFMGSLSMLTDITKRKEAENKLQETFENLENLVKKRTEELEKAYYSLKEGEQSLTEAQKMALIGNWKWDIVNDRAYWSDELYHIFGRNPQKAGPSFNEFLNYLHPDDRDNVRIVLENSKHTNPNSIDFRIIRDDGEERSVVMQSKLVLDGKNNPVQMRGIVQDITERVKSEEKIRNLANIVESSLDAIGTISPEGFITNWNKGAEQIYGYSQEEILGKPVSFLSPPHLSDELKNLIERVLQGESIKYYETLRLRKDGKLIDVALTLSPVYNSHGKLISIAVISRDITERKTIEEKLRESEEKYRNIVETSSEGIIIIDKDGIITFANNKIVDMLGFTINEGIGRPVWDFLSEESKALVKLNLKNRELGIEDSYELKLIKKDGSNLWTLVNAKALFDKDDHYIGSLSMLTDITRRKEAEQALENFMITREKEIYHRIKNNLQVVSSLLDLQSYTFKGRSDINDSEVMDAFRESQNRVMSMALIHEELYKGGSLETINFSEYVEKLSDSLLSAYRIGNLNIRLIKDLDENLFFGTDTAIPLGTIINELVSNSFKYAFPGRSEGEIRIMLHREEKDFIKTREESKGEGSGSTNLLLLVSDNGIGIPKNLDIENLDSLGLYLVTSLVEQINGTLEIKRNNGTEFIIKFTVSEKNNRESARVPNSEKEYTNFYN